MKFFSKNLPYTLATIIAGIFLIYSIMVRACSLSSVDGAYANTVFCSVASLTEGAIPALGIVMCLLVALTAFFSYVFAIVRKPDRAASRLKWAISFLVCAVVIFCSKFLAH